MRKIELSKELYLILKCHSSSSYPKRVDTLFKGEKKYLVTVSPNCIYHAIKVNATSI